MTYLIAAYLFFALLSYRKAVLALAPLALALYMFPVIHGQMFSMVDFCCLGLTALLPFKTNVVSSFKEYPFKIPCFLVFFSYCITNVLAEAHWPSTIIVFNTIYIYPLVVWTQLKSEDDIRFLIKGFMVLFGVAAMYALIELALDDNFVLDSFLSQGIVNQNVINYDEHRFGIKRLQSFFCTPMSMGLSMGAFAYVMYELDKMNKEKSLYYSILMIGCFVLPWLTGARSVFVAEFLILIPVLKRLMSSGRFLLLKMALVGSAVFALGGWVTLLVDSFVHSDTAVTGSSFDMRLIQFAVILPFFLNSPIWGNGYAYTWSFVKAVDQDILGAESIWLQVLVDNGLIGALAYIACISSMVIQLRKCKKDYIVIPLSVIAAYTMSTFLGLDLNYFFILSMMLIKYHEFNQEKTEKETPAVESESKSDADPMP
ncbi:MULTISPECIES: O-antigen ligase [unclassified Fibrobacter]|uniref:O-antigen ligase family protein n=1 Tax=unclassified Fibrobacter TaxID=2634177 RepID=UPI000D6B1DED|nr:MULTISPECIES: O-antigen ligase family protein [unclassified Fibrobacter]PWJ64034.1 O-antigen ligase-like membrane protein [Fibrobacter sp. UWR4]PZW69229.1 O-antigen ligase-like membrane protein [Fibrobacter sp. UWR1]